MHNTHMQSEWCLLSHESLKQGRQPISPQKRQKQIACVENVRTVTKGDIILLGDEVSMVKENGTTYKGQPYRASKAHSGTREGQW